MTLGQPSASSMRRSSLPGREWFWLRTRRACGAHAHGQRFGAARRGFQLFPELRHTVVIAPGADYTDAVAMLAVILHLRAVAA